MTDAPPLRRPLPRTSIGAHIRLLRRQSGMTQQDLANAIGVARSTVAFWETDRGDPDSGTLARIGEALDVPLEMFLTGMISRRRQEMLEIDEAMLLDFYRRCSVESRLGIIRTASRLSEAEATGSDDAPEMS